MKTYIDELNEKYADKIGKYCQLLNFGPDKKGIFLGFYVPDGKNISIKLAKPIGNQIIAYDSADKIFYLYFRACNGKTMVFNKVTIGNGIGFDFQINEDVTADTIAAIEVVFLYNVPKGNKNYNFAFISQQDMFGCDV